MTERTAMLLILVLGGCTQCFGADTASPVPAKKSRLPNIIFYFADDLGWGDNETNNPASKIPTPNLNTLASQGITFTDAHASGSTCAPSRYGLLTGRNPMVYRNFQYKLTSAAWDCLTLPAMLRKKGYTTHAIGKWHFSVHFKNRKGEFEFYPRKPKPRSVKGKFDLTADTKYGPLDRGFDTFFGTPFQPGGGWYCNMIGRKLEGKPYINERGQPQTDDFDVVKWLEVLTNKSVEKINEQAKQEKPFFLYIPINSPHNPIVPDDPFKGKTVIGDYGDYCYQVDCSLGKVMNAVKESGIYENTIFIFSSDNGSFAPNNKDLQSVKKGEDKTSHAANGHWRGAKKDLWEGGHRVPYLVRWPKVIPAGAKSSATVSLMDHMATFAAIVDYPLTKKDGTDSHNILPLWKGAEGPPASGKRTLFHYGPREEAVRQGRWKLILKNGGPKATEGAPGSIQLYDLEKDPSEKTNLSNQYPEIVKKLIDQLNAYRISKASAPHAL